MTVDTQTTVDGETVPESHVLDFTYDASGNPQTMTCDGVTYYYSVNIQGDVMAILDENGTIMVHYIRQGYGLGYYIVPSNATGSMLNKLNPFGYRGYVRDRETYLYYLESRYYSEDLCRFLNADAYASTGQGLLGNNMFAYCGNSPVMCIDPTGEFWWIIPAIIIPAILTACGDSDNPLPRSDLANAPDLDVNSAPNGSYNCMGNAIGKQIVAKPSGYDMGDSVEDTFLSLQRDLGGERNCIRLDSYDSPIEDGWYVVAMMCGETDFHFIRLDEKGWYNKSGFDSNVGGCYVPFSMVHTDIWYAVGIVDLRSFQSPGSRSCASHAWQPQYAGHRDFRTNAPPV